MSEIIKELTPRTVFLLDASGALISTILLAVVLPSLESIIGMPYRVLYLLAGLAGMLLAASTFCSIFASRRWKPLLIAVAVGNLFYCVLTAAAIVWFKGDLTTIGKIYFAGELAIIFSIAVGELLYAFRRRPGI